MAQLSQETIEKLQEITRKEYGRDLSFEEVSNLAYGLIGFFDTLAGIYHQEQEDKPP